VDLHGKPTDPYRVFFPLGIPLGVFGVLIWPLYYHGVTEGYSGRAHAFVQTCGFLYAFILGFLLTAIPRFTGTEPPGRRIQYALAFVLGISAVAFEFQSFPVGQTGFAIAHFTLILMAARRFLRRRQNPPERSRLIAEYGFGLQAMALMRAALVSAVILTTIQPWRLPSARTTLAWCVWTANWFLILAVWLAAAAPQYRVDFLHVLFIGGFTLLIFAVGARVVLSHGGYSLAKEQKSWPLRIGLGTGLVAMLARTGAPFAPFTYFAHLAWAACFWIGGILVWGLYMARLIRK
jgi:uncharacterized protein involved in response to NO